MAPSTLSAIAALLGLVAPIAAQSISTPVITVNLPLESYSFAYPNVPEKVMPFQTGRGPQFGYNQCNSSTLGPNSDCQTIFMNNIGDFCLWGPSTPGSSIADTEAAEIGWCTQPTHGTRVIAAGCITGVQWVTTSVYVQAVGFIDQTCIDMAADDSGGELDPAGADGEGNPLGALVYSNSLPSNNGNNNTFVQSIFWTEFLGNGIFCFKACDASQPNAANFCQHLYDRLGCSYNSPASYEQINGTFTSCESDLQDPAGTYVSNGQTITYQQPPESLGPINSVPFTARIPASSNCVTFQSADIFAANTAKPTSPSASITPPPSKSSTPSAKSTSSSSTANSGGEPRAMMVAGIVGGIAIGAAAIIL